eukprot:7853817-Alexandrium_andersonii.AAC.1
MAAVWRPEAVQPGCVEALTYTAAAGAAAAARCSILGTAVVVAFCRLRRPSSRPLPRATSGTVTLCTLPPT